METYFAPPERQPMEVIRALSRHIANDELANTLLKAFNGIVMIVNEQRQILAVNNNLLDMLQLEDGLAVFGLRPGEAINCVHSVDCINGCGTGEFCRTCGAVKCMLRALETNKPEDGECLLNLGPGGSISMEFAIRAFPVDICDEHLIVILLRDISAEKFSEALEQTFFHDIMNTVTGVAGYSALFDYSSPDHYPELAEKIKLLSERLVDEVDFQRVLRSAPAGGYEISKQEVSMAEVASRLDKCYGEYWGARGRFLEMLPVSEDLFTQSDPILIYRVLINMVKNAMEATQEDGTVKVSCTLQESSIAWEVWNEGKIPEEVAERIFQRFFSTKGSHGRGLGTYGMKLFGEHYLGGKVDFTTSEEEGTVFRFNLPL